MVDMKKRGPLIELQPERKSFVCCIRLQFTTKVRHVGPHCHEGGRHRRRHHNRELKKQDDYKQKFTFF